MTPQDTPVSKTSPTPPPAKEAPAKKAPAKKSPAKKAPAKKASAEKERELDLVLYGATGFVGRLVCDYLLASAPAGVRIGIAGRNGGRLEKLRYELGDAARDWTVLVADADDDEALTRMARSTRVVATTVGPYAKFGLPVVAACARNGTHYADLTGEVLFVRDCIDRFDSIAVDSGAKIVNSCGFDSIPSDLGVYLTFLEAAAAGSGGLTETQLVVKSVRGGFSGGTVDSLRTQVDVVAGNPELQRIVADPFSLSPDRAAEPAVGGGAPSDVRGFRHNDELGIWTGPFVMAAYNTRIVRRSNALLDWAYGPHFQYSEVVGFGAGPSAPLLAAGMTIGLAGLQLGMRIGPVREILDRVLPDPGEGPSQATRDSGHFRLEIVSVTEQGQRYRTVVAAQGDPGYAATSVMLGESALCLALDEGDLPDRAGVLTPATAMGSALLARLRRAGFTFDVGPAV
ncbi:MAG TPA: saccharopine dehydrogenase NADP-binding domain-containing protein [Actinomycetota bacterium]|nr:saccharopine dehydrogenase NADP-binding domain-containing protein [Actinomycetota bacterium]